MVPRVRFRLDFMVKNGIRFGGLYLNLYLHTSLYW